MAAIRVLAKVISTLASVSAGGLRAYAGAAGRISQEAASTGAAAAGGQIPQTGAVALADESESGVDALIGAAVFAAAPVRAVPPLLRLLAETTRASSNHDEDATERLAAEYAVLLDRYGTLKELVDAIATGRRRIAHAAQDRARAWQQVMSVTSASLEPALRRHRDLLAELTAWVARQPGDLEHRLDRYRAWLDEDEQDFEAKARTLRACVAVGRGDNAPAHDPPGPPSTDRAASADPMGDQHGHSASNHASRVAASLGPIEPAIPLLPPPLTPSAGEAIEGVLACVIDAKHPAEQLTARSIDREHQGLAERLRASPDPIERLIGAIALGDFDFADAALQAQAEHLGPANAARLRGDRLYWEGRFDEAIPHYRAQAQAHDDLIARCNLACALIRSHRGSREQNAEEALDILRRTIALLPSGTPERARVLTVLGATKELTPTGDHEERLREALRCYEQALQSLDRDRDGIWWAGAHLHAGLALLGLHSGERAENLRHAIQHFRSALEHWTRDSDPSHWSTVQNNLGRAWERLPTGDRRRNLENAKACFEAALEVRTQSEHPAAWARLHNNLGNLHLQLPDADGGSHIHRAIEHHTNAAKVWSSLGRRHDWAAAQASLGNAWALLPTDPGDPGTRDRHAGRAIACYRSALEVRSKSTTPHEWAATMNNLGSVLMGVPDQPGRSEHLDEAIRCFRHALEVRSRDRFPLDWARTVANLAQALARRTVGDREKQLHESMAMLEDAAQLATALRHPELQRMIVHRREAIIRERARPA